MISHFSSSSTKHYSSEFRVGVVLGRISLVILSGAIGSNTHHIITIWLPEKENIKALKGAKIVS